MNSITIKSSSTAIVIGLASLLAMTIISCKKLIEIDQPINQPTSALVFTSDKSAESTILGLYSKVISSTSFANGGMTIYGGMLSDELINPTPGPNDEFSKNTVSPSNTAISTSFWGNAYNYIYQCNAILEGLEKSTAVSPLTKNRILGETKFMRAFCYFYLVNTFGDVPLITATDYKENAKIGRTPSLQVYNQILNDLQEAQNLLDANYPTTERARPNKLTVTAFLARLYLYLNDFQHSEEQASMVLNSGIYGLVTDLTKVFVSSSNETIWQLMPNSTLTSSTVNVSEANFFIPVSGQIPQDTIAASLFNSFETGDNRKTSWISNITIGGKNYTYPFKYRVKSGSSITEYYIVFRLAEQYLIRAEARAQRNNLLGAISDINLIRGRAGLSPLSNSLTQSQILTAVEMERRHEYMFEWGHRWLDLKRTARANPVLSAEKGSNWQVTDQLLPIPALELQKNPRLTQNPGY